MCISRMQKREVETNTLGLLFKTPSIVCSRIMSIWQFSSKLCQKPLLQKKQQQRLSGASFWQQCYFFCLDLFWKWFKAILFFFFSSFYVLDISSLKVKVVNWPHKYLSVCSWQVLSEAFSCLWIISAKSRAQNDNLK